MSVIKVLPKEISELIAAGEVIDRPVSVVKELVENSIDAGANRIEIAIESGGLSLISVLDNGCGFDKDDLKTAFIRHATSKIKLASDLNAIDTLGFRGEALPSIAAVCKVKISSKGYSYTYGQDTIDSPYINGTLIEVRDIFYNTPARLKFLKKDVIEGSAIKVLVERLALYNPNVSFKLKLDGKIVLFTPGDNNLLSNIRIIFGTDVSSNMLKVDYKTDGISVIGYIGKPSFNRASRSLQLFYINNRLIKSNTICSALEDAFRHYIMIGKFLCGILNIQIDSGSIDVNVHPAKLEVRFSNEMFIYNSVKTAVMEALKVYDTESVKQNDKINIFSLSAFDHTENQTILDIPKRNDFEVKFEKKESNFKISEPQIIEVTKEEKKSIIERDYRVIGEVFNTYILVEQNDLVHIIDKHAAHERENYNKLLEISKDKSQRQILLTPKVVQLTSDEYSSISDNLDVLDRIGITAEIFGNNQIIIREVPLMLLDIDFSDLLCDIASKISSNHGMLNSSIIDDMQYRTACRASIMGGNKNTTLELEKIADFVLGEEKIRYCPHGRPAIITLKKIDFEKMFGRLG